MPDGAIPIKYKELMALAVAFTTQWPYCIEIHSGKARLAGATDPEIAEVVTIAAAPPDGRSHHSRYSCVSGSIRGAVPLACDLAFFWGDLAYD
ncbi:MAG: carboxymuconolactone decarboxylase family protein [Bryobacteraceae bacterium]